VVKPKKVWTDLGIGKFGAGEYTDPTTDGLIMLVRPGARGLRRSWFYRYTFGGKRPKLGLGPYPAVGLAQAREEARRAAAKVVKGVHPAESRASRALTFLEAAEAHIARAAPRFKNENPVTACVMRCWFTANCCTLAPFSTSDRSTSPIS
jgi:hypothetical protein